MAGKILLNKHSIVDAVVIWNGQKLRTKALLDTGASLNVMTAGIWRAFDRAEGSGVRCETG